MEPLATYKPPPASEEAEHILVAIHHALNDIDRRLYRSVETLRKRRDELIAAYKAVGETFAAEAEAHGLSDCLRYIVLNRIFGTIVYEDDTLDEARKLYHNMEQCGFPDVHGLISIRITWANVLADANQRDEARSIAKQLVADIEAFRERYPGVFVEDCDDDDDDLARFRREHGI